MKNLRTKMKNIEKYLEKLKLLSECKPKMRKLLLQNADEGFIATINECMQNFLIGNINLNATLMKKIQKYKNTIRQFSKQSCFKKKKEILVQEGGFLPLLIPTVVSIITSLIK